MDDAFHTLVDKLPYALIIHNGDRVFYANNSCATLMGYKEGKDLLSLRSFAYVLGRDGEKDIATYYRNNGESIECRQYRFPIKWRGYSASCMLVEAIEKSAAKDIKEINQCVNDASTSRTRFLAAVSHEMRTPLNALINLSHLLNNTTLDANQEEMVKIAQNSAQELLDRIEDVLEFSQLESERIEPSLEAINISHTIEPVIELLRFEASKRNVNFETKIDARADNIFLGSAPALRRIIRHLGENAMKYGDQGDISIEVEIGENQRGVLINVSDTGPGIDPDKIRNLFKPFSFDDDPVNRTIGGLSLGLALTRAITRTLGGELSIEPNHPQGTKASVYLPFEIQALEEDDSNLTDEDFSLNILVAEDNKTNQKVIRLILDQLGHRVTTADDGAKCIETLDTQGFDVILMDLHMPFMDGYEATKIIRKNGNQIPIYALTADARVEARNDAINAGMNGFLTKPLMVGDLQNALCEIAASRAENRKAA